MTAKQLNEEQMVSLVRNALLVAGQEMGPEGDHWPVINSTIHSIMKDWEDLKIERNVDVELKTHLYAQLEQMEKNIVHFSVDVQRDVEPKLKQLRDIYDAYFLDAENAEPLRAEEIPTQIKRAKAIIDTLEEENA